MAEHGPAISRNGKLLVSGRSYQLGLNQDFPSSQPATRSVRKRTVLAERLEQRTFASVSPVLGSFTLVNASTDQDLGKLIQGQIVDLTSTGAKLNVRANASTSTVKSVKFTIDGHLVRVESYDTFALAGNTGSDYNAWTPSVGGHSLIATPYAGVGATGAAGPALKVDFQVKQTPIPPPGLAISSFTLVNAKTDKDVGLFSSGQTIDMRATGRELNIRANPKAAVISVKFELDGKPFSIDNTATFALAGNNGADYYSWTPSAGPHKLVATPYSSSNATGTAGSPTTILFTVVDVPIKNAPSISWSANAPASPTARTESQVIQVGSKVYVFGGFTAGTEGDGSFPVTRRSDVLDLATGEWRRISDLPATAPVNHGALASDGRFIYLAGGQITGGYGPGTTAVFKYDPQTNIWTSFIRLPEIRFGGALVFLNNKLEYFGGDKADRTTVSNVHWQLDLATPDAGWLAKKVMPVGSDHLSQAVINGKIYLVGGEHGHHALSGAGGTSGDATYTQYNYLYRYDPVTDTYTRLDNLAVATSHAEATTLVINKKIVVIGGILDGNHPHDNIQVYDPVTNKWTLLGSKAPYAFDGGVAGYYDGKIYLSDGYSPTPPAQGTTTGWWGVLSGI